MSDNKIPDMPENEKLLDALEWAKLCAGLFGYQWRMEDVEYAQTLAAAVFSLQAQNEKIKAVAFQAQNAAIEINEKYTKLLAMNDGCEVALQESRQKYNILFKFAEKQNEVICLLFDAATQDQSSFSAFLDILKLARITEEQFEELTK